MAFPMRIEILLVRYLVCPDSEDPASGGSFSSAFSADSGDANFATSDNIFIIFYQYTALHGYNYLTDDFSGWSIQHT
jgi:hypothetical protein